MIKTIITSTIMTVILTVLVGIVYPLAMTGIAQLVFPKQANGSLIERDGKVIGSELIGQQFADAKFFRSRPSAAGTGYDAANSGATNLGPTSKALMDRLTHDRDSLRKLYPELAGALPADMITSSASGLDPDITIANAMLQAKIVARTNNLQMDAVEALVRSHIQGRDLGFLGEPRVNVLALNLDLLKHRKQP
ncbi:MAG: potassium-transporting ATPase subunit KdpC [Bacteroidota bacterium]|nr:potassium-transporting ATPase subunit KdpC [Bacteroidota bacterium]MDP4233308.1 potassium-transporting ATPase subunit KdpC [Bacteroidota bacterium]MDP4242072.1 potassium-transporting ATPase subunit KdpC [Bacteroidota bacterium]MDP4288650.1 potassium-transporting ATPase subunit KdpC [Bacteroidota bacterium]